MRLPPNAKKWQSIAVVTKHPNSIYVLAAAPRQPLETIQAPTYEKVSVNSNVVFFPRRRQQPEEV